MLDLTDVLLTEGKVIQREAVLGLEALTYRFGTFPVAEKAPVSLTIEHASGRKLLLDGETRLQVLIPCARCLEPVAAGLDVRLHLEIEADDRDYMDGYNLNIDQLVHDEALLIWPERILCREDCRGLCPVCGQNLNEKSCGCERTDYDPRMAKILDIFSNFKEV